MRFDTLPLKPSVLESIDAMQFETATPIQEQAIPAIQTGKDLLACAQTGTGKTAAFLIPTINKYAQEDHKGIKCLIVVPTRELAVQIDQTVEGLSYFTGVTSIAVYGGNNSDNFSQQKNALKQGSDIVIATPGRLLAHMNLGYVDFSQVDTFILDEADRMLDMGFYSDIIKINKDLPKQKQNLMFSATMATQMRKLAESILDHPTQINLAIAKPAEGINQQAYLVYPENKVDLLTHLVEDLQPKSMIVFASRKVTVDDMYRSLKRKNVQVEKIHSGCEQEEREQILLDFKSGKFNVLVATDILARGIDIDDLSHVVNFDIPDDPADYVHRIGRTARAGSTGAGISFISPGDQYKFANIEKLIEKPVNKNIPPESVGKSFEYDPEAHEKKKKNNRPHRNKKNFRKGSKNQSGGKRNNHRNRNNRGPKKEGDKNHQNKNRSQQSVPKKEGGNQQTKPKNNRPPEKN